MTVPSGSGLLAEAPAGRHFAQFHRHSTTLVESAFDFLETGLRRGQSVLVIVERDHLDQLLDRLTASKLHSKALTNSGQLGLMDAGKMVEEFLADGLPEWSRFRASLGPVLMRIQPYGSGTRVYSDIAGLLWRSGKTEAAIRIEELWNKLAESYQFALYCGFLMDTHCEDAYDAPLEELGRTHSDILATSEDEQFGAALDRASKEIFGISLTQMAGVTRQDGARRFPSGQRTMLWVTRNLPLSMGQLAEKARQYFQNDGAVRPQP
ncbi:MAG TPA: MEDS domain-containing protein [Gemmatimonadales bacterium]|nr:MEDS domain-containing protein [Gemmatimonadales bacterium]